MWGRAYRGEPLPPSTTPDGGGHLRSPSSLQLAEVRPAVPTTASPWINQGPERTEMVSRYLGRLDFLGAWARTFRRNDRSEPAVPEYALPRASREVRAQWPRTCSSRTRRRRVMSCLAALSSYSRKIPRPTLFC